MTVSLGGIALSEDLTLDGVVNQPNALLQADQTLGGSVAISWISRSAGRELILQSVNSGNSISGFFTGEQVSQIMEFRDTVQAVTLEHHLGIFEVVVVELGLSPATGTVNPTNDSWYVGTVQMIEV